ncbi:L-rhamnonate dehydratase [Georgenia sp. TF02-10]|uniref:L-rhamnonate dehydratase n=1 Tax=Georgenia sp. TF02-10 TaxID=2917725 RepID=UPI001FA7472B|nr:L-rhamnonate dehydratase [Georgenia sp. TF02-10]UNX54297.1 L-rhamnonate dehydratase [Georgenia sp. TF02-10]
MRITAVRAYVRADHEDTRTPPQPAPPLGAASAATPWQQRPIASPLSVHPGHEVRTIGGPAWAGDVVVEVESDEGSFGIGVSVGGRAGCWVVEDHLAPLLVGEPVDDITRLWDLMWRATQFYGRKGLVLHAISAVDLALWDLLGRSRGESVMRLVGGPVRDEVTFYATTPDAGAARRLGFIGCKLPLPYGPAAGRAGFDANVGLFAEARDAVGDDLFLAYDCWMALDVDTAVRLADALAPYRPSWLEECLLPDDLDGLRALRSQVRPEIMLAGGEHEATRWGFRALVDAAGLGMLQPDPTWCGGLSELLQIAEVARSADLPIVCHGSGPYGLHASAALEGIPMAECIIGSGRGDTVTPFFGDLFLSEPLPHDGTLQVDELDRPGFGVELNPAVTLVRPTCGDQPRKDR